MELKETVKKNLESGQEYRKDQKKKAKTKQEVIKIHTATGAVKEKFINVETWPDGTIVRSVVGLKKDGKVIFDKGIKK